MQLSTEATIPFPRAVVFAAYRDKLVELVPYLPNIRSIEVRERSELADGTVVFVNEWVGGGNIPKVARAVLSENMLSWTDHARWLPGDAICEWKSVVHAFPGAITCEGHNRYRDTPDGGTVLHIEGVIACDAAKVPGVPRFVAGSVGRTVEKVLVGQIGDNLRSVAAGVARYLAAEAAG